MPPTLRIATRKSPLALWQAEHVRTLLQQKFPGLQVEILGMTTQGDRILDTPLAKIGGKGLFVKELEQGLLEGRADIAVHSMKDVPVDLPKGLEIAAILAREDPRDAFVSCHYSDIKSLPLGAKVGTSSLRRQCQLRARRPDLQVLDLRGNVNTRLKRLDMGEFDAILLAGAGLIRLGLRDRITQWLSIKESVPAVGQGAIGIECRSGDDVTRHFLKVLHDPETARCISAERALNAKLQGGCQVPIAAHASIIPKIEMSWMWMRALVGNPEGTRLVRAEVFGGDSVEIGEALAEELLICGAKEILEKIHKEAKGFSN